MITTIVGIVFLILGIFALVKFTHGTITAALSFLVILISLVFIFGVNSDLYQQGTEYVDKVQGLIPGTGNTVLAGQHIEIANIGIQGDASVIHVLNTGTEQINGLEVYVNGKPASIGAESTVLPGTQGTVIIDGAVITGDVVLVKTGTTKDEFIFGVDGNKITGGVTSPLIL